jgi:phasin family protein
MADPVPLIDMSKIIEQFTLPGVDMSAILEARRKDIETVTQVNKIAFEGLLSMAQKQAEILKTTMEELRSATQEMAARSGNVPASPLVRLTLEKAFGYMHEIAELTCKSQSEALDVINRHVVRNVEELKNVMQSKR